MASSVYGKRILVTGCAGFIGTHLAARLLESGALVIGIDDRPFSHEGLVSAQLVDVASPAAGELDCDRVEAIIHLAAQTGVESTGKDPVRTFSVNVLGTLNMLALARRLKARQFCLLSSSEVYGEAREQPISESVTLSPRSAYGLSKQCAEAALSLAVNATLTGIIIRPFNVYGPGQRGEFVIARFLDEALRGSPHTIVGDGSQKRTFTYVEDLVSGILLSLEHSRNTLNIFNLAGEQPTTISALASLIDSITRNRAVPIYKTPSQLGRRENTEIHTRIAGIAKAQSELGYRPRVSLESGIALTAGALVRVST